MNERTQIEKIKSMNEQMNVRALLWVWMIRLLNYWFLVWTKGVSNVTWNLVTRVSGTRCIWPSSCCYLSIFYEFRWGKLSDQRMTIEIFQSIVYSERSAHLEHPNISHILNLNCVTSLIKTFVNQLECIVSNNNDCQKGAGNLSGIDIQRASRIRFFS